MNNLLFITNEMLSPKLQNEMHLPLEFVCFGITNARMYTYNRSKKTFITIDNEKQRWGNNKVYGAIFLLKDFDFYIRILDSYFICSLSMLFKNHSYDMNHRIKLPITPIFFDSLEQLQYLRYNEVDNSILVQSYVVNTTYPKIKQQMDTTNNSHRIISGIDSKHFKELFWEVKKT